MRTTLRAAVALALVAIVLLVKVHLDSISQWQVSSHRRTETRDSYFLQDDNSYIEVATEELSKTPSITRKKWIPTGRPSPRPMSATAKLKRIPVKVPGAESSWGQDPISEYFRSHGLPDTRKPKAQQPKPWRHDKLKAPTIAPLPHLETTQKSDRIIVMAKLSYEDTSWMENQLPKYALTFLI